jgi:hypothetical protein
VQPTQAWNEAFTDYLEVIVHIMLIVEEEHDTVGMIEGTARVEMTH